MARPLSLRFVAALAAPLLVLSACGGDDDTAATPTPTPTSADQSVDPSEATTTPTVEPTAAPTPTPAADVDLADLAVRPVITIPDGEPPTELEIEDIVAGSGTVAHTGDAVLMRYVGASWSTGLEFDASWNRDQAFEFELGAGNVIAGWDQGIDGMAIGGRRRLTIPGDLAYGAAGRGQLIGPDETLVFIVDLLAVVPADAPKPSVTVPDAPATEFSFEELIVGDGATLETGDTVYVHYVGVAQSTGEQFDASWDRGPAPVMKVAGIGQFIPGIEAGLVGMHVGGRRQLIIPPDLGFGDTGAGDGAIAPGETLVFVIDLIWVDHPSEN
jgi:peptidylprolyl isomerase